MEDNRYPLPLLVEYCLVYGKLYSIDLQSVKHLFVKSLLQLMDTSLYRLIGIGVMVCVIRKLFSMLHLVFVSKAVALPFYTVATAAPIRDLDK